MVATTRTATMLAAWVGVGACFFTGTATAQSCTFHGAPCPPNDELAFACASGDTAQEPWCDTGATLPRRVASLVAAMTLPEKIAQLSTYSFAKNTHAVNHRHTPSIPRLGLPGYNYHSEGLHGDRVRRHVCVRAVATPCSRMLTTDRLDCLRGISVRAPLVAFRFLFKYAPCRRNDSRTWGAHQENPSSIRARC